MNLSGGAHPLAAAGPQRARRSQRAPRPPERPKTTLVLGGARSGKSELAERLARALPAPVTYLATAVPDPHDSEFAARLAAHRRRRPPEWGTVEAGAGLVQALAGTVGSALVDSLGTWVAATWDQTHGSAGDFAAPAGELSRALRARQGDTVVVSEEVGLGVHPSSPAGIRFRDVLGSLNQEVARVSDRVLLVVAGRALTLEEP